MRAVIRRLVLLLAFLLAGLNTTRADACEKIVGRLVSLQGTVETRGPGQAAWRVAQLNERFCHGDAIRTGARSRAALELANETVVRLDQLTTLSLSGLDDQATFWVDLFNGAAHFLSRTPRALKVKTPYVNAGVEGTEFVVRADQNEGSVSVLEGRVRADNTLGVVVLGSGESAAARTGQAPVARLAMHPRDAVQWSLYYPPLFEPSGLTGTASWVEPAQSSFAAYLAGDSAAAFAAIATVPANVTDARFFNYRAGLLLSVGRVDEAQADIVRALDRAAENPHTQALQSVVALARNDKPAALDLARKASTRDPQSMPAWIALSYVQQAAFDLEGARTSVEQALGRAPENVLVLARLSELWLSLGDLNRALETANRAVALNPNVARTQTVLGFAYLTQVKTVKARQAFERAIAVDSADPLPRLGLGLALIRTGELEAGRREIEIAAALDPNNALIRSYLGKAYYEEKRNPLAVAQLDMARQLDPNDPTPWFYDAIRKQTENRPVEALQDLQKSIELNDNRAVYRSRLLLDQDLAMRNTSQARTYRELGMNPVAETKAIQSITLDPANPSSHRFLADSYLGRPRYEIARASEQLQSQLLQPINMNPVQPQSAATNLTLLSSATPGEATFNEFTPLFVRNDVQLTTSAQVGNFATYGDELALYGIQNRLSYSLGQFHYETDGFRPGSDVRHDIYSAFAQVQVFQGLDVQLEFRSRETEQGDLRMVADPNFVPTERRALDQDIIRLGVHYAPSPMSDFIASVAYSSRAEWLVDTQPAGIVTGDSDAHGYDTELQYLFRQGAVNGTIGGGLYDVEDDSLAVLTIGPIVIPVLDGVFRTKQYNGYVYVNVPFDDRVTATLGMSYESLESDSPKLGISEFNPKLGLQWEVSQGIRVRAAAFDVTKRALLINQTIEPTQVAGFNQFFDDTTGTRARSYGLAVDLTRQGGFYAGLEAHRRDLEEPLIVGSTVLADERDDDIYRAYLYWAPHTRWAFSADYQFEGLRGEIDSNQPNMLDTTSVPLGVRYFHPSGIYGSLVTTYVRQQVSYAPTSFVPSSQEDFTVVDASIGYRLPRRLGRLSIEAMNLFDRKFQYQDNSFVTSDRFNVNPKYLPVRSVLVKAVLNF